MAGVSGGFSPRSGGRAVATGSAMQPMHTQQPHRHHDQARDFMFLPWARSAVTRPPAAPPCSLRGNIEPATLARDSSVDLAAASGAPTEE